MTRSERDRLARLEEQYRGLSEDLREVRDDLKAILATLAAARGGWRTLLLLGGVAGGLGALGAKLVALFGLWR